MPEKKPDRSWVRLSSIGVELVGAVAGFTLLGYWVDRHWGTDPWGLLAGVGLGLIGGMYNLIRQSLLATREDAGRSTGKSKGSSERPDR
jgi:ATP synthase protein I